MKGDTEDYLEVVLEELKNNTSIKYFRLYNDEDLQNKAWPLIQKELTTNIENEQTYLDFCEEQGNNECWTIWVDKIKLSLKFHVVIQFEGKLNKEELHNLKYFLKHPSHKIVALDMASSNFMQSEI